ncbi:hypothetical protein [Streptosporangium sp. NBC_01756]|nr:hypothetical protein [Streptosporangium sp. NBC_01756]WSC85112.1 hypothetical protein OIE48_32850 [Streptosporangium sp. NBC_01756]
MMRSRRGVRAAGDRRTLEAVERALRGLAPPREPEPELVAAW